jgi:NAD+ diphosphatase
MHRPFNFCPACASPLQAKLLEHGSRQVCPQCAYVHWDNPVPVVAALIEHQGGILLAHNRQWPAGIFGLISGFLEATDESPELAVQREVREELGLETGLPRWIGNYSFAAQNQIILAYHVAAEGEVCLGGELDAWRRVPAEKLRYWPFGTGLAVRDWLLAQGYAAESLPLAP